MSTPEKYIEISDGNTFRSIEVLNPEYAKTLPTHRLLAYYKSIRHLLYIDPDRPITDFVKAKSEYRETLTSILDNREHVED